MRRHHAGQAGRQPIVGLGIVGQNGLERALVHRHSDMAVGSDETVAREVLAAIGHAGLQQAVHQALGEQADDAGVAVESPVADHRAAAVGQVQHRREAQIDAAGPQLSAQHIAGSGRGIGRSHRIGHPQIAQHRHRRQVGEAIAAKALHPAALMVDADQQVRPDRLDLGRQRSELGPVNPVAGEQHQATGQRMLQPAPVVGV